DPVASRAPGRRPAIRRLAFSCTEERRSIAPMSVSDPPATLELPRTVHPLEVDGKRVFLVGTAHVSTSSVDDVRTTIDRVRPNSVCVELCQPRYDSITNPEAWKKLDILSVLREGKAHLLLGSLIITAFQRRIASQL